MTDYKSTKSFSERREESLRVIRKYPGRVPIICEGKSPLKLSNNKYLVPGELTVGQFLTVIRKKLTIHATESLFIFCTNTVPRMSAALSDVYAEYVDPDGFLYMTVSRENTFGN